MGKLYEEHQQVRSSRSGVSLQLTTEPSYLVVYGNIPMVARVQEATRSRVSPSKIVAPLALTFAIGSSTKSVRYILI